MSKATLEHPAETPQEQRARLQGELADLHARLGEVQAQRSGKETEAAQRKVAIDHRVEAATLQGKLYPGDDHAADLAAWRECADIVERHETAGRALQREAERVQAVLNAVERDCLALELQRCSEAACGIVERIEANRAELIQLLERLDATQREYDESFVPFKRRSGMVETVRPSNITPASLRFPVKMVELQNEIDRPVYRLEKGVRAYQGLNTGRYRINRT